MNNLINKLKTPFYLYNESKLIESVQRFLDISYENKKIFAATMSNNNVEILKILRKFNIGVFVNSRIHLEKVYDCGFRDDEIVYTATAIKKDILEILIKNNNIINIDSIQQLRLYGSLNPGGKVGIRLNVAEFFLGEIYDSVDNRIGINEKEFDEVKKIAKEYNIIINGLHVYLGTHIVNYEYLQESIKKTIEVSKKIEHLEFIDFGGGFPVQGMNNLYFDYKKYDEFITKEMNALSDYFNRSIQLIIEPGRALFGECGTFYATILDVKEREDKFLICCDSSTSVFPRPMFYQEYHDVKPLNQDIETNTYKKPVSIVGHTTFSKDYFIKDLTNFKIQKEGNRLMFLYAGGYCFSMITNFLGQEIPDEWLLTGNDEIVSINEIKKVEITADLA